MKTSPLLGQYKSCFHSKIDIVENAQGLNVIRTLCSC